MSSLPDDLTGLTGFVGAAAPDGWGERPDSDTGAATDVIVLRGQLLRYALSSSCWMLGAS